MSASRNHFGSRRTRLTITHRNDMDLIQLHPWFHSKRYNYVTLCLKVLLEQ